MNRVSYNKFELDECVVIRQMNPDQFMGKIWREVDGNRHLMEVSHLILPGLMAIKTVLSVCKAFILYEDRTNDVFDEKNRMLESYNRQRYLW